MTVKLLLDYRIDGLNYKIGNLVTTSAGTEAGLISSKMASSDLTGGTAYVAPVAQVQSTPVTATVNALTGGVRLTASGVPVLDTPAHSMTLTGSYAGNGTVQTINCGFQPDFVVVKADSTIVGIFSSTMTWYGRSDPFNNVDSSGGAITFVESGFSVGAAAECNTNAVTYYYFAYKDNGSNSLLQTNWQGNATAGRKINSFKGKSVKGVLIKRDAPQKSVWALPGIGAFDMSGNFGTYCVINSDGTLTLDASDETNQWSGNLGEGTSCLGFSGNDVYSSVYVGNATARRIPLPWQAEFIIIQPLSVIGQNAHIWFSSLAANTCFSIAPAAALTGRITSVDGGSVSLSSGTQLNTASGGYMLMAFKRNRLNTAIQAPRQTLISKAVQLASGGYIDCGTSDTLKFNGAHTVEWFGAVYPPKLTPAIGGVGADTEANIQNPMISRSNGADATDGNMSFCLAATAPRMEGAGQRQGDWSGAAVTWATTSNWAMPQAAIASLDNFPSFSGVVLNPGQLYHVVVTHDGTGGWVMYLNGVVVKERQRDLVAAIGKPNIQGGSGHRTVIGARQTTAISFAYGQQFRLARIYARALTASEAQANYLSLFDSIYAPTSEFLEEWSAMNAYGDGIPATVKSANNGTIVSGSVVGL